MSNYKYNSQLLVICTHDIFLTQFAHTIVFNSFHIFVIYYVLRNRMIKVKCFEYHIIHTIYLKCTPILNKLFCI